MLDQVVQFVPTFVLSFFRLATLCLSAPLFGSARVPRRVKIMFALVLAMAHTQSAVTRLVMPANAWMAVVGIGGEIVFGLAMGTALTFVFVAVNWAGDIIGQQMGINLGEVFDPSMGQQSSLIGDMYFLLTLVIFLTVRGHHAVLRAVETSFTTLPLMSVGVNAGIFQLLTGLLNSAMALAIQLAAPMLITALVVDLVLGFIGKTIPQMNVMAAGLSLRSAVGIMVMIVGLSLSSEVIKEAMGDSIRQISAAWNNPSP